MANSEQRTANSEQRTANSEQRTANSEQRTQVKSAKNSNLHRASKAKEDEFYTQLADVENELKHFKAHFKGKTIYCNCDDPFISNFFRYFSYNFEHLGLKNLKYSL